MIMRHLILAIWRSSFPTGITGSRNLKRAKMRMAGSFMFLLWNFSAGSRVRWNPSVMPAVILWKSCRKSWILTESAILNRITDVILNWLLIWEIMTGQNYITRCIVLWRKIRWRYGRIGRAERMMRPGRKVHPECTIRLWKKAKTELKARQCRRKLRRRCRKNGNLTRRIVFIGKRTARNFGWLALTGRRAAVIMCS